MAKKLTLDELKSKLIYKNEDCFEKMSKKELDKCDKYCEDYKSFINVSKTHGTCLQI